MLLFILRVPITQFLCAVWTAGTCLEHSLIFSTLGRVFPQQPGSHSFRHANAFPGFPVKLTYLLKSKIFIKPASLKFKNITSAHFWRKPFKVKCFTFVYCWFNIKNHDKLDMIIHHTPALFIPSTGVKGESRTPILLESYPTPSSYLTSPPFFISRL